MGQIGKEKTVINDQGKVLLRKKTVWEKVKENKAAYLFLLPKLIFFMTFMFIPIVWAFFISFQDRGVFDVEWVWFKHYIAAFESPIFRAALWNTFVFTIVTVPAFIITALIISSMIHPLGRRSQTFFRAAFYLPTVTSMVIIAMVWRWMYNYRFGLFNYIIEFFGFESVNWLGQTSTALPSLMIMAILIPPGAGIIIYLAAMNNINPSLYEAADIDGATSFQKWIRITIPLLKPTTLYLTILSTIGSFQVFTQIIMMTGGGPGYATETVVHVIYKSAFRDFNFGLASAQSVILFFIIMVFAIFQFKTLQTEK
ncbi:carbohydrate ABC transporter permease [Salisediminibacterium selenitireducens]|uniref:Binding-protein-dependent transport systems inner membrane component n=1 Tax=Bacillus selenitireducens (strain ATCC 700615 / DSM 15326 / MLS10) TaxID=439292 RepID=D6XVW6_BACIE|nr:sugar ABC transporter permease [Salisediminibacterium selenitireducens]ADH97739.1 binding-protein-dependent transport systems inner membrane component [[Bacillus] selenitireducens MLS10]